MPHDFYPRNYYYSFATKKLGCSNGHTWCGDAGVNGIQCVTGSNCSNARANFCKKYGIGGFCYGEHGNPPTTQQRTGGFAIRPDFKARIQKDHPNTKSGETVHPFDTSKGDPNTASISDRSTSPSGCQNCNFGDVMCQIMKAGCEAQHTAGGFFGGAIPWTLVAVGGGAIILLLILLKRR
jgi:hypothetical protein